MRPVATDGRFGCNEMFIAKNKNQVGPLKLLTTKAAVLISSSGFVSAEIKPPFFKKLALTVWQSLLRHFFAVFTSKRWLFASGQDKKILLKAH